MKKNIKFIDLCAGIGGFHLALKDKASCILASEINTDCQKVYKQNFNINPVGDLALIDTKKIEDFDILCAGFPCQPFSISGKQLGFYDNRGNVFFNILSIIRDKKPKTILLENVKNLINHDKKQTIKTIIKLIEELGYNLTYKVLNSVDFGVPQNRERVIIVCDLDKKFDFNNIKYKSKVNLSDFLIKQDCNYLEKEEYTIINKELWKKQNSGLIFCGYLNKNTRVKKTEKMNLNLSRYHRQPNRIYHIEGMNPTISSQEVAGRYFVYDNIGVRKLTIDEIYSIMGFPRNFIKSNSKINQYRQIGNSVCIPMVKSVCDEIINQLF